MNRFAILGLVIAALALAGVCFVEFVPQPNPVVDGSSEANFKASLDSAKASLAKDQSAAFEAAMVSHARAALVPEGDGGNVFIGLMALSADKDGPARRLRSRIDGLTAQQIISTAANLPDMTEARRNANESAAIATLKNISSGQSQCQASGVIDTNNNGQGEYGYFGELSGCTAIRGSTLSITPPVLSAAFGNVSDSYVTRVSYVFQIFLPSAAAAGIAEDRAGGDIMNDNGVDSGQAEELWCCYAWPITAGDSGNRAFFINQAGDVLASRNIVTNYSGASKKPDPMAAFLPTETGMGGAIAANTIGTDGESWIVVN